MAKEVIPNTGSSNVWIKIQSKHEYNVLNNIIIISVNSIKSSHTLKVKYNKIGESNNVVFLICVIQFLYLKTCGNFGLNPSSKHGGRKFPFSVVQVRRNQLENRTHFVLHVNTINYCPW